jgi:hypothetical protein
VYRLPDTFKPLCVLSTDYGLLAHWHNRFAEVMYLVYF